MTSAQAAIGGSALAPADVTRRDIEAFVRHRLSTVKPATVSADFRALQQSFKWLLHEEEIEKNPMDGAKTPIVPEVPVPLLEIEQLRALLDGCAANDFVSRRDNAIIRLLVDTGGRLTEVAELAGGDVDFDAGLCHVSGKGRRTRALPFGQSTALALGRYLRVRNSERAVERIAAGRKLTVSNHGRAPRSDPTRHPCRPTDSRR
ncbi:MAG: tyrosine-type recombinase/integrase [Jatrophihabitans sp.]